MTEERQEGMGGGHVAADELRLLIERAAEAASRGYDKKAIRRILAIRKKKREDYQEEEAIVETYLSALGMI